MVVIWFLELGLEYNKDSVLEKIIVLDGI